MSKISALIFSLNEYELIKPKIELLYPYVDEIVIVDSSTDKSQKRLMKSLEKKYKKVRVVWLPPLGVADFYYKIGINECKYEWVLVLDADHMPNVELLQDLRKLTSDKYDVYFIYSGPYIPKLFKKDLIEPLGIIHWIIASKTKKFKVLDKNKYYIIDTREYNLKFLERNYLYKYPIFEAVAFPLRILEGKKIYKEYFLPFVSKNDKEIYRILSKISSDKILMLYFATIFYFLFLFVYVIKDRRNKRIWLLYPIKSFINFIKEPYKNLLIARISHKIGFLNFLGLDKKENLLKYSKKLNFTSSGVENYIKLLNERFKYFMLSKNFRKS